MLGARSDAARASESQKLLNYGFQFYDTVQLYQNGQPVSTRLRCGRAPTNSVPAGFVADQYVTLPKGQAPKLKLTMEAIEPLVAPGARGQRVGVVKVTLEDKPDRRVSAGGAGRRSAGQLLRARVGHRAALVQVTRMSTSKGRSPTAIGNSRVILSERSESKDLLYKREGPRQ